MPDKKNICQIRHSKRILFLNPSPSSSNDIEIVMCFSKWAGGVYF